MRLFHCSKNLKSDTEKWKRQDELISAAMIYARIHSYPEFERAPKAQKEDVLRFLLEVVKRDLATHAAAGLLAQDVVAHGGMLFPVDCFGNETDKGHVPFAGRTVVSQSYQRDKFFPAINDVMRDGFHPKRNDSSGLYFPDWELILIENGIHHLAVATILGESGDRTADCRTIYLRDVFPHLSLSKNFENWVFSNRREEPVFEPRFALLYAISKELYSLERESND